jgi:multiple sugar transport system substrate-binding protein
MRLKLKLLFLSILGLLLFACTPPRGENGKTLIVFWDFPRLPAVRQWLEREIEVYENLHPDVDIQYTCLSWSKGGERMAISAFAYRPPDVAGSVMDTKYVQAGLLAPLDKYLDEPIPGDESGKTFRQDIHASILKAVEWQGVTYAFPWYKEAMVMVCNMDVFNERGVAFPENGRWSWEEFIEKMQKLTFVRDTNGKTEVYGVGFNTGNEKWEAYPFLLGEGMEILSADGRKMLIDSEDTRRGIMRLLEMEFKYKVSLPGAGGIQDDATWTAFSGKQRQLGVSCQGLWSLFGVKVQNERRLQFIKDHSEAEAPPPLNVAAAQYPIMPGKKQVMGSYGVGSYMVFNRPEEPKRTEAAARFARWITLESGQEINREAGVLPSRISFQNIFKDDTLYQYIVDTIPDAISPPVHPAWRNLDTALNEQLQLALLRQVQDDNGRTINTTRTGPLNESDIRAVDAAVKRMQKMGQLILDDYWAAQGKGKFEE